jgi:hypothetical protein
MRTGNAGKYVVELCIGNYGSSARLSICMVANSCFSFMVKLTMTASFLSILAILRTFTFNSYISIKHNTATIE